MPRDGSNRHRDRDGNDHGHRHWNRNDDWHRHHGQHGYRHDHQSAADDDATIEPATESVTRLAAPER